MSNSQENMRGAENQTNIEETPFDFCKVIIAVALWCLTLWYGFRHLNRLKAQKLE